MVFFFNQYLYNRDADQKITVGVAEGICGKEWPVVRQAIEEIAWHQPQDELVIIKTIKDRLWGESQSLKP